jgi:hypothetical protein
MPCIMQTLLHSRVPRDDTEPFGERERAMRATEAIGENEPLRVVPSSALKVSSACGRCREGRGKRAERPSNRRRRGAPFSTRAPFLAYSRGSAAGGLGGGAATALARQPALECNDAVRGALAPSSRRIRTEHTADVAATRAAMACHARPETRPTREVERLLTACYTAMSVLDAILTYQANKLQ